jgi:hypothetical protein
VASSRSNPSDTKGATFEDRCVTVALVFATALALLRVLRSALGADAVDADFSMAMVFLLVGGWLLAAEARERGARWRRRRRNANIEP